MDGSALAYRSYFAFARHPLRATSGETTSVVHGFLTALLRWLRQLEPAAVAVAFDPPGPTFRHRLDPEYKANRPERPADLVEQIPRLRQALVAMRVPLIEVPGWEADDVLATLARRTEARGDDVWVASADKDFLQLLSARVRVLRPASPGGGDDEIWGPAELHERTGLAPDQVVDAMALSGDATDNVPGVAGVGKKTAYDLIREHGSLDRLYSELERVTRPALRARLEAGREAAARSRALVRLEMDVPLEIAPESLLWAGPDGPAIRSLLRELELVQVLRLLPPERARAGLAEPPRVIEDAAGLQSLRDELETVDAFALVVVPSGGDPMRAEPLAFAFASVHGIAVVACAAAAAAPPPGELALGFPAAAGLECKRVLEAFAPLFADRNRHVIGHDLKSTLVLLREHGLELAGPLADTMLQAYVLDAARRQHELDALVLEYLDQQLEHDLFEPGDRSRDPRRAARSRLVQFAAARADAVLRLHAVLESRVTAARLDALLNDVELPLLRVLAAMEGAGVRVDSVALAALARELESRCDDLAAAVG